MSEFLLSSLYLNVKQAQTAKVERKVRAKGVEKQQSSIRVPNTMSNPIGRSCSFMILISLESPVCALSNSNSVSPKGLPAKKCFGSESSFLYSFRDTYFMAAQDTFVISILLKDTNTTLPIQQVPYPSISSRGSIAPPVSFIVSMAYFRNTGPPKRHTLLRARYTQDFKRGFLTYLFYDLNGRTQGTISFMICFLVYHSIGDWFFLVEKEQGRAKRDTLRNLEMIILILNIE